MKKPIDVELLKSVTPDLPDEFDGWIKDWMPRMQIFYRREKKGASCICGKCGMEYQTEDRPVRHEPAECSYCGQKGIYEWKKVTTPQMYDLQFAILQTTTDKRLVLRTFECKQRVQQYTCAKQEVTEIERKFFSMSGMEVINKGYCFREGSWVRDWQQGKSKEVYGGRLYPGYTHVIQNTDMKYCDVETLSEMTYSSMLNGWSLGSILAAYIHNPAIEMYAKSGMSKLVGTLICHGGKSRYIYKNGKTLQKQIRLKDKQLIKKFVKSKGDILLLEILQYEQKTGIRWTDEQEEFAIRYRRELDTFLEYMSLQQLMNRIEKYSKEQNAYSEYSTIIRYSDYLKMRKELGYDMTNEVFIHPKNLRKKHEEMVKENNQRKDELRITKKNAEFSNIRESYEKISEKYSFETEEYFIRPASSAGEIILEGQTLHHCVGSSDTYMRKHHKGESYIMFLRRKSEPETPYYTIEIRNTEIVQWYSLNDRKPDEETIRNVLDLWIQHLEADKKKRKTA